jgi:hypothetical protein
MVPAYGYHRHEPEKTLLYRVVQENLETFLQAAALRDPGGVGLPRYVEQTFRRFLRCGILQNGFVRVRCPGCGFNSLVAFS